MLNLLIKLNTGKLVLLEKVHYTEKVRCKLDEKTRRGIILDVEILPDNLSEMRNKLFEKGVVRGVIET